MLRAVETLNAADVASAVSVLHDLQVGRAGGGPPAAASLTITASGSCLSQCLSAESEAVVASCVTHATAVIADALDTRQVAVAAQTAIEGSAGTSSIVSSSAALKQQPPHGAASASATAPRVSLMPPAGAAAAWRGVLWGRVEAMCEALHRSALQARAVAATLRRDVLSEQAVVCIVLRVRQCCPSQVWNFAYVLSRARDSEGRVLLALDLCSSPYVAAEAALVLVPPAAATAAGAPGPDGASPATSATALLSRPGLLHPAALLLHRFWREAFSSLEVQVRVCVCARARARGTMSVLLGGAEEALPASRASASPDPASPPCDLQLSELVAADAAAFVRGTLVDAYPRVHYLLLDACARAGKSASLRATGEAPLLVPGGVSAAGDRVGTLLEQVWHFGGGGAPCHPPHAFFLLAGRSAGCGKSTGWGGPIQRGLPCAPGCVGPRPASAPLPGSLRGPLERCTLPHVLRLFRPCAGCTGGGTAAQGTSPIQASSC